MGVKSHILIRPFLHYFFITGNMGSTTVSVWGKRIGLQPVANEVNQAPWVRRDGSWRDAVHGVFAVDEEHECVRGVRYIRDDVRVARAEHGVLLMSVARLDLARG